MKCLKDFLLNKNTGQWSFGLHRLTGVLLAIYLIPHIIVNSAALWGGAEAYNRLSGMVQGPAFHFLEIAIILGVAFHLTNGIRIILVDLFPWSKAQQKLLTASIVLTGLVLVYSIYVYLPKLLGH